MDEYIELMKKMRSYADAKDYWDNYENTVMGMNEHIGHNPVSAEKYKAQFEKELNEKGVSKE